MGVQLCTFCRSSSFIASSPNCNSSSRFRSNLRRFFIRPVILAIKTDFSKFIHSINWLWFSQSILPHPIESLMPIGKLWKSPILDLNFLSCCSIAQVAFFFRFVRLLIIHDFFSLLNCLNLCMVLILVNYIGNIRPENYP